MSDEIRIKMKVVLNKCYGGFSLSDAAQLEIAKRKGIELFRDEHGFLKIKGEGHRWLHYELARNDPDLIAVVEEMGEAASGRCAELVVKEIELCVDIESYDGMESVSVSKGW